MAKNITSKYHFKERDFKKSSNRYMVKLRCDSTQITSQLARNVYFPKMNSRNNVKYHLAEVFNKEAIWLYAELKSHI